MFIIEGNIGAGKSTFLTMLGKRLPHLITCVEPLNQWHNEAYGQSLLEKFYHDPQRWAYTLETFTLQCRIQEHLRDQARAENALCIAERSIFSSHYVFAANSYQQHFMKSIEWQLYASLFTMATKPCKAPKGFIYLQTDPDVAFKRIQKRQRSAEKTISFEYIVAIHQKHESLFSFSSIRLEDNKYLAPIPTIVINTNQDFECDGSLFEEHVQRVQEFLTTYDDTDNRTSS